MELQQASKNLMHEVGRVIAWIKKSLGKQSDLAVLYCTSCIQRDSVALMQTKTSTLERIRGLTQRLLRGNKASVDQ